VETEDLYDASGHPVPDPGHPTQTANLRTFPIPADQNDPRFKVLDAMHDGTSPNWDYYAYYSSDLIGYIIEEAADRYTGNPPSWCNGVPGDPRFALTGTGLSRNTITLCPDAFLDIAEPYETVGDALSSDKAKALGSDLVTAAPRSLTLLHELVHLTMGVANTLDSASMSFPRLLLPSYR
jgi:hypothetical protein